MDLKNNSEMRNIPFFLSVTVLLLSSCSSDYDNDMDAANECIEQKLGDGSIKFRNIKDALYAYDFESARMIANCLPDKCYYGNGDIRSSSPDREDYFDVYDYKSPSQVYPFLDAMKEILTAELSYYFDKGEVAFAKKLCDEMSAGELFTAAIPKALENAANQGDFEKAIELISTITLNSSFRRDGGSNYNYSEEAKGYNAQLDMVLNKAILKGDENAIPALLLLYKPIVKENSKGKDYLSDQPKEDAIARVREGKEHL